MKKLFLLIISIFNFGFLFPVNKPVKASINQESVEKEIIAKVGSITYEDLQYNGYSIVSSNVNFNRPGRYNICYQNDETKEKIEKQVNIKTLEEMINGVVYSKEKCIEINTDGSYIFKKVSKDDDGSYYISYTRTYINEIDSSQTFDMGIIKIKNEN